MEKVNGKEVVTVNIKWAITILLTAVLGSAGAGIWGYLAIANTLPFRVDALEKDYAEIKKDYMPLDLSTEKWKKNDEDHATFAQSLIRIEGKLDEFIKTNKK